MCGARSARCRTRLPGAYLSLTFCRQGRGMTSDAEIWRTARDLIAEQGAKRAEAYAKKQIDEMASSANFVGNLDRKSVVSGKSVSVRVEHGGRRYIKKKKKKRKETSDSR